MTPGHLLRIAIIIFLVVLLLGRRRGRRAPAAPATVPGPGGPQQLGTFHILPTSAQVTPVHGPGLSAIGTTSNALPLSHSETSPDWNSAPIPDWNTRSVSPSLAESDELGKLDSLRGTGTLTESAYLEARARLFGTASPAGWSVTLLNAGSNKIKAIKALRECRRDLDLSGAKNLVDHVPQTLFRGLARINAEQVTTYLQQAGVPAQFGPDA